MSRRDVFFPYLAWNKKARVSLLFVKIPNTMRPEGHDEEEDNNELFDDIPETFLLCALHQGVNFPSIN